MGSCNVIGLHSTGGDSNESVQPIKVRGPLVRSTVNIHILQPFLSNPASTLSSP